jgi:hypothetical protein
MSYAGSGLTAQYCFEENPISRLVRGVLAKKILLLTSILGGLKQSIMIGRIKQRQQLPVR